MKIKLRIGEGYALSNPKLKQFNIRYISLLAVATSMCLYAVKQVSAQGAEPAATAVQDIKPLKIGDTIPDYLWRLPLQVVNHPEGKDTITLNDYRGKSILLDFLSTGCSGCIAAIPKLEAARNDFGEDVCIIAITPQKLDRVAAFIPKNKYSSGSHLPFVVEDEILKEHFPHRYISHVVWIDAKGKVRAFTSTNHVTIRTIREFRRGSPLDWPVKTETTSFFNAPLIEFQTGADVLPNNIRRPLYYSLVTGYTEGVGPYVATRQDSLMGIERVSFRNRAIIDLYMIALGESSPGRDFIIWNVPDASFYALWKADRSSITTDQWRQRNAVCYERTFPLGTVKEVWQKAMLADLNAFLHVRGHLEMRNGKSYFVLSIKQ